MNDTPLGKVERTERGFEFIKFKDRYDAPCSLQQSSLAEFQQPGTSAVWLGVDQLPAREGAGFDQDMVVTRMHLDVDQVKNLIAVLEHWLEEGTFSTR